LHDALPICQFSNEMPSLMVPCTAAMNSCSLMPSIWWKLRKVGTVASPTPTVPITSDSTSTMSSTLPSILDSAAAAIQPAVPPPAMTTRLTCRPWVSLASLFTAVSSAVDAFQQARAQAAGAVLVQRRQHAAGMFGDVRGGVRVGLEHVVAEGLLP